MGAAPADEGLNRSTGGVTYATHPIEALLTEHDRQRIVCAALERLANDLDAGDAQNNAGYVLDYLENELPLHIADEENDLFPLLERRCLPEDQIDEMLALLSAEHAEDDAHREELIEPLRAIAAGSKPPDGISFVRHAHAFATFQRRHLAWENGTILPLARKRLSERDQLELGRKLAARHGLSDND